MAKVNVVNKQVRMNLVDIIKFQLITHCYINHITLSELDYDCLTNLGVLGTTELTEFCNYMADKRVNDKMSQLSQDGSSKKKPTPSPQTIRNVLIKVEKEGLLLKEGKGRKRISIHPDLKIQTWGNILLNHKIVHIEPQEA